MYLKGKTSLRMQSKYNPKLTPKIPAFTPHFPVFISFAFQLLIDKDKFTSSNYEKARIMKPVRFVHK